MGGMGHAGMGMRRGMGVGHPGFGRGFGRGVSHFRGFARGRHFAFRNFRHGRFFRHRRFAFVGVGDDCWTRIWTRWGWRLVYVCY